MVRKVKDEANLSESAIKFVIKMLEEPTEGTKAWTKKACCDYLGIAYNTTRLGTLIEKHKADKLREAERRAANRGKPPTPGEIQFTVISYLEGGTIESISSSLYRSSDFVKRVLDAQNVPIRQTSHDYFNPSFIPEAAVRERFKVGETVYAARYDSIAKIEAETKHADGWVYRLWLKSDRWQQFCYQPACELASLEHLGMEFK